MRALRVLVGCEWSGRVRDEFRRLGHEAWSCDLEGVEPAGEWSNYHLFGDVRNFVGQAPGGVPWDLAIFFPECTYLASSGLHWNVRVPGREKKTTRALSFVRQLLSVDIAHVALENPRGRIGTAIRRADQTIQPHQFGEDASKATCLWLKNLPLLVPTGHVEPRFVDGKPRWSNQTDSNQNRLGPSPDRAKIRGITYVGIAKAMAEQWSRYVALGVTR